MSDLIVLYLVACIIRDGCVVHWSTQGQYERITQEPILTQIVLEAVLLATENLRKDIIQDLTE
ncbi:hypothetical protein F4779DRAFT_601898 [Xylariaceae sp. FL0662B]|nr:hypothetical protein F4779DRAFT_601898 [Xylariaceae sp. FL0662B]